MTAFRSTLEEVSLADIMIHVRDMTNKETEYQKEHVLKIVEQLHNGPQLLSNHIEVWNKIDLLGDSCIKFPEPSDAQVLLDMARKTKSTAPHILPVSALCGTN